MRCPRASRSTRPGRRGPSGSWRQPLCESTLQTGLVWAWGLTVAKPSANPSARPSLSVLTVSTRSRRGPYRAKAPFDCRRCRPEPVGVMTWSLGGRYASEPPPSTNASASCAPRRQLQLGRGGCAVTKTSPHASDRYVRVADGDACQLPSPECESWARCLNLDRAATHLPV